MTSGRKKTHLEFINDLRKKNKNAQNIQILTKYENNTTPILCKCNICNYEWKTTPKNLLKGHGCPNCANVIKFTNKKFLEQMNKKNIHANEIIFLEQYKGMSQKIKCECKKCGFIWRPTAKDLLYKNSGCPQCSKNTGYTHSEFIKLLKLRNLKSETFEICGKYNGMNKRIKCKCKICGNIWSPIASSLMQGSGCPKCAKEENANRGRSFLPTINKQEIMTNEAFLENLEQRNPFFDQIAFLENYKGSLNTIKCKCKICGNVWNPIASSLMQGSGCPKCSHSSTSFMEQFIFNSLVYVLGEKEVVNRCKSIINSEIDIYIPTYHQAIEIGSWNWHKKNYNKDLLKIEQCKNLGINLLIFYDSCKENPDKVVPNVYFYKNDIGSERNYNTLKQIVIYIFKKINVDVNFSNEIWEKIIKISYKKSQRINHNDFLNKFYKQNANANDIELLTKYTRAKDYIKCKCKICGKEWNVVAEELLRGRGCPKCARNNVAKNKSKKNIIKEWQEKNPNGTKLLCEKETGISRVTIYKWWNKE